MSEPIAAKAFLSAAEIGRIIGVTPKCIRQWGRTRADDFPAPSIVRKRAMRWRTSLIAGWLEANEKQR